MCGGFETSNLSVKRVEINNHNHCQVFISYSYCPHYWCHWRHYLIDQSTMYFMYEASTALSWRATVHSFNLLVINWSLCLIQLCRTGTYLETICSSICHFRKPEPRVSCLPKPSSGCSNYDRSRVGSQAVASRRHKVHVQMRSFWSLWVLVLILETN